MQAARWINDGTRNWLWSPIDGVIFTIHFDVNRYEMLNRHAPQKKLEAECYEWWMKVIDDEGRILFSDSSGDVSYVSGGSRYMSLEDCKDSAVEYYNDILKSSISNERSRKLQEIQDLDVAMKVLKGESRND